MAGVFLYAWLNLNHLFTREEPGKDKATDTKRTQERQSVNTCLRSKNKNLTAELFHVIIELSPKQTIRIINSRVLSRWSLSQGFELGCSTANT